MTHRFNFDDEEKSSLFNYWTCDKVYIVVYIYIYSRVCDLYFYTVLSEAEEKYFMIFKFSLNFYC